MAESLNIAPEEARRLLAQVRGAQTNGGIQQARIRREHGKLARRIAWCVAAGVLTELLFHFLP